MPELAPALVAAVGRVAVLAAFAQRGAGFGSALVAMPLLVILLEVRAAYVLSQPGNGGISSEAISICTADVVPLIVNLIDVQDPAGRWRPPGAAERGAFRDALTARLGQPIVWRYSGGAEVGAACGMLAGGAQAGASATMGEA